jgi:hypothetical protein
MAKNSFRRGSENQFLRVQKLAGPDRIADLCSLTPVTSTFIAPHPKRSLGARCAKVSRSGPSNGRDGCSSSKRGPLRRPNRERWSKIFHRHGAWGPPSRRGAESGASK